MGFNSGFKGLTSSYIRCDGDGIDLPQDACKPRKIFILCVMWEARVLVGQVLALQEGSAVGWMANESFISF